MCRLVLENGDPSIKSGPTPRRQGTSFYGHNSRMRQEEQRLQTRRCSKGMTYRGVHSNFTKPKRQPPPRRFRCVVDHIDFQCITRVWVPEGDGKYLVSREAWSTWMLGLSFLRSRGMVSIQLGLCCRKLRWCGKTPRCKILHWMNFDPVRAHLMSFRYKIL